jgi:hypothetical protein
MWKTMAMATFGISVATAGLAGTPQEWNDLPKAVQETVLANGGQAGMTLDRQNKKIDGKEVYEAGVKATDGTIHDLVITADGTLVATKTDDHADEQAERAARGEAILKGLKFSRPREITNPYLPLATVKQDVLEGMEDGEKIRVERRMKPNKRRTYTFGDEEVESLVFEDRVYVNGKLAEVALDFFAQDDHGTVYYLGEDVDEYEDGKIIGHDGTWHYGLDTRVPGVLFPAQPKIGLKWRSEDVSNDISEIDEVVSLSEKVTTPCGTYENCIKVKESLADGTSEFKYYARGVGVVRESPAEGDSLLKSHETIQAK